MGVVVFCAACAAQKDWSRPSIRVTSDPCDFCGGWDAYRTRKTNHVTGKSEIKVTKLKNFEHDERFLPGTAAETRLQEPLT